MTAGLPGTGPITEAELTAWLADPRVHRTLDVQLPKGLEAAEANVFIPENNPITLAKIELGRQLYFDTGCPQIRPSVAPHVMIPSKAMGQRLGSE